MKYLLLVTCILISCANPFKKDNEPQEPTNNIVEQVKETRQVYLTESKPLYDDLGFSVHSGSVGDSALFTCIAYASGATEIDIMNLFQQMETGLKPIRHKKVNPKISKTPISKDMFNGTMTCLYVYGKKNKQHALEIAEQVIAFGRSNKYLSTWNFCTKEDVKQYNISDKDLVGKCVMTPAVVKDFFRLAIWLGWECDAGCKLTMETAPNLPFGSSGYSRHLSVWTTWRNGKIEGSINDISLDSLRKAAESQPRNALYQAIYATYKDGDMAKTGVALTDETLFPKDRLPTEQQYCTDYLMQRDETRKEELVVTNGCIEYFHHTEKVKIRDCKIKDNNGDLIPDGETVEKLVYNKDWLPCEGDNPKLMEDWLAAAAMYKGDL